MAIVPLIVIPFLSNGTPVGDRLAIFDFSLSVDVFTHLHLPFFFFYSSRIPIEFFSFLCVCAASAAAAVRGCEQLAGRERSNYHGYVRRS